MVASASTKTAFYIRRVANFCQLAQDNPGASWHCQLAMQAASLLLEMIEHYGSLEAVVDNFTISSHSASEITQDVTCNFRRLGEYSISILHERYDYLLKEIAEHFTYTPFKPKVCVRDALNFDFMSCDDLAKKVPQLWDVNGNLLHNFDAFYATSQDFACIQIKAFALNNPNALQNALSQISSDPLKEKEFRHLVLTAALQISLNHSAMSNPSRLALLPHLDLNKEFLDRLYNILYCISEQDPNTLPVDAIDNLFDSYCGLCEKERLQGINTIQCELAKMQALVRMG